MTHDTPPKRIWTFDRYVNGILMAEGVEIEKAETFEQAAKAAVRLASSGPKGEAPVLVLRDTSEAEAMVAAALREAAELVADDHVSDAILNLADNHAAAALDKLIAEAMKNSAERQLRITGPNSDGEYWLHLKGFGRSGGINLGTTHGGIVRSLLDAFSENAAKGAQT